MEDVGLMYSSLVEHHELSQQYCRKNDPRQKLEQVKLVKRCITELAIYFIFILML